MKAASYIEMVRHAVGLVNGLAPDCGGEADRLGAVGNGAVGNGAGGLTPVSPAAFR